MLDELTARTVRIAGHRGEPIEAYLASPLGPGQYPGVVVIHHLPGYDAATKEITRRFAAHGYHAICPNLYSLIAPGAAPDDAAATARAAGGLSDTELVGHVGGAVAHLRGLRDSTGKVGVIGYCSGGRQSFLVACTLPVDAAVDCYGAFVVGEVPPGFPLAVTPLLDRAAELGCPLLGLFGAEDRHPSPADVRVLDEELTRLGKPHEFHSHPEAGHAFFAVDRVAYRPAAAAEGWARIWDFFGTHLGG